MGKESGTARKNQKFNTRPGLSRDYDSNEPMYDGCGAKDRHANQIHQLTEPECARGLLPHGESPNLKRWRVPHEPNLRARYFW